MAMSDIDIYSVEISIIRRGVAESDNNLARLNKFDIRHIAMSNNCFIIHTLHKIYSQIFLDIFMIDVRTRFIGFDTVFICHGSCARSKEV